MGSASSSSAVSDGPMRAVTRGGSPAIKFNAAGELPEKLYPRLPAPGTDEVLLKVHASAINPVDYKVPAALLGYVVGLDVAGVVTHVGENSTSPFKVGDKVYGTARGALADRVLAKSGSLGSMPDRWTFVQAAAVPTTYVTALQALQRYGQMRPGADVLVIGASGGCGTAAIQVAKALGCGRVVAVCSGKNAQYCLDQGADYIVDYTSQSILDSIEEDAAATPRGAQGTSKLPTYDVVYDCATNSGAGEDYKADALRVLRQDPKQRHGQYVAINGAVGMWLRKFTIGQRANEHLFLTDMNTADLDQISSMESLQPRVITELPLNEESVDKAFGLLQSRRAVGKIVFNMDLL